MGGFSLNTNKYAIYANARTNSTNEKLGSSLEKLSSGLSINKAADDASGLAIANSLRSQSDGLMQSIKNANDAVGLVQIADNAMDEMSSILNIIRTKSIQSAQDGQSYASRQALQKDTQKLMEEYNNIATTTSFNGQVLLSGAYSNKEFQVGAYSNETIGITIDATDTTAVGHIREEKYDITHLNGDRDIKKGDAISLELNGIQLESVVMGTDNGQGIGRLVQTINSNSNELKARATYTTETVTSSPIRAGDVQNLTINGINLGNITDILPNDSDNKLVSVINSVKDTTGVNAFIDAAGLLHLNSSDGRAIELENMGNVVPLKYEGQADFLPPAAGDDLTINGQAIGIPAGSDLQASIDAINAFSSTTGVKAYSATVEPSLVPNRLVLDGFITEITTTNVSGGFETGIVDRGDRNINFGELNLTRIGTSDIITNFSVNNLEGDSALYTAPVAGDIVRINGVDITAAGGETPQGLADLINLSSPTTDVVATVDVITGNLKLEGKINELSGLNTIGPIQDIKFNTEVAVNETISNLDLVNTDDLLTTREGAMRAIDILDAAIKDLDSIRSDLGSTQNQLTSTINNITITQANVKIAESNIRDADFAVETNEFNKYKLLSQAGTFALSQANAVQQNVMKLLQ
jgi:flagellin